MGAKKDGSFELRGRAAGIYSEAQGGKIPETEQEADELIVTIIHLMMQGDKLDGAVAALHHVRTIGSLAYARALVEYVAARRAKEG